MALVSTSLSQSFAKDGRYFSQPARIKCVQYSTTNARLSIHCMKGTSVHLLHSLNQWCRYQLGLQPSARVHPCVIDEVPARADTNTSSNALEKASDSTRRINRKCSLEVSTCNLARCRACRCASPSVHHEQLHGFPSHSTTDQALSFDYQARSSNILPSHSIDSGACAGASQTYGRRPYRGLSLHSNAPEPIQRKQEMSAKDNEYTN